MSKELRVIELDYQMTKGTCAIPTTVVLINYLLKRLYLDTYQNQAEEVQ